MDSFTLDVPSFQRELESVGERRSARSWCLVGTSLIDLPPFPQFLPEFPVEFLVPAFPKRSVLPEPTEGPE